MAYNYIKSILFIFRSFFLLLPLICLPAALPNIKPHLKRNRNSTSIFWLSFIDLRRVFKSLCIHNNDSKTSIFLEQRSCAVNDLLTRKPFIEKIIYITYTFYLDLISISMFLLFYFYPFLNCSWLFCFCRNKSRDKRVKHVQIFFFTF